MAKIVFKFFEVIVKDDDIVPFVKKMEEVLDKFAGETCHFRYYIEEPPIMTRPKTQRNGSKDRNANGHHTNRVWRLGLRRPAGLTPS